jgi:chromate transport protein ChrA
MNWKDWGSNAQQPRPSRRYRIRAALPGSIAMALIVFLGWHGHSWTRMLVTGIIVFAGSFCVDYFITYRRYRH